MKHIVIVLTSLLVLSILTSPAFAREKEECRRFLGFEFSCNTVVANFVVSKQVRIVDEGDFVSSLDKVLDEQELEFRIEVTNTGESTEDSLKIRDVLPETLDFLQANNEYVAFDNQVLSVSLGKGFGPGDVWSLTYTTKAKADSVEEGQSQCTSNNVILFDDINDDDNVQSEEHENNTATTVCVAKGEVQGVSTTASDTTLAQADNGLPETAAFDYFPVVVALFTSGAGLFLTRRVSFHSKS